MAIILPDTNGNLPHKIVSLYTGNINNEPKKITAIYVGDTNNAPKILYKALNIAVKIEVIMVHMGSNYSSLGGLNNLIAYTKLNLTAQITDTNIPSNVAIPVLFYAKINGNSNSNYVAINTTDYLTSNTAVTKSFTKSYSNISEMNNGWHASNGAQIKEAYIQYNGVKYCLTTNITCKASSNDYTQYSNTFNDNFTVVI